MITARSLRRKKEFTNPFKRCMKCGGKLLTILVDKAVNKNVYLFTCPKCGRSYSREQDESKVREKLPKMEKLYPIQMNK